MAVKRSVKPVATEVGRWMLQFRQDSGMTATTAGKSVRCGSARIRDIEKGLHTPVLETIMTLLWVYDVSEMDAVAFFAAILKEDSRSRLSHSE